MPENISRRKDFLKSEFTKPVKGDTNKIVEFGGELVTGPSNIYKAYELFLLLC